MFFDNLNGRVAQALPCSCDIKIISHLFGENLMCGYIADIARKALGAGADDITSFFSLSKFQLCWRYMQF